MAAPPQYLKKGRAWRRRLGPPDGGGLCRKVVFASLKGKVAAPPQFLKKGRVWRRRLGPPDGGGLCRKGRRAFGPRVVDCPAGNAYNAYMVSVTGISSLCFSHPWLSGEISHLRWLPPFGAYGTTFPPQKRGHNNPQGTIPLISISRHNSAKSSPSGVAR